MKVRLTRLLSFVLAMAFLLSAFTVLPYAESNDGEEEISSDTVVMVNRNFEEGWDYNNGFSSVNEKYQKFSIDYEETATYDYNYFMRFDKSVDDGDEWDGYAQIDMPSFLNGSVVVAFDVNVDCYCDVGTISYIMTTPHSATRAVFGTYKIRDNKLILSQGGEDFTVCEFAGSWIRTTTVYHLNQSTRYCSGCGNIYEFVKDKKESCVCGNRSEQAVIEVKSYFGTRDSFDIEGAIDIADVDFETEALDLNVNTYYRTNYAFPMSGQGATISTFRFGFSENPSGTAGQSYMMDNLAVYFNDTLTDEDGKSVMMDPVLDIYDVDKYGYGTLTNDGASKVIPIISGGLGDGVDYLKESIIMKTGSDYLLYGGDERRAIFENSDGEAYGAPFKQGGAVYVPFEPFLDITKFPIFVHDDGVSYDISSVSGNASITMGRDSAVVNGKRVKLSATPFIAVDPDDPENSYPVISKDDVEILFPGYYLTYDDMGFIMFSEGKDVYNRKYDLNKMVELVEDIIYPFTEEDMLYDQLKESTNNFDHPYLIVNEEKIDYMRGVYNGEIEDPLYKEYIDTYLKDCENYFRRFTTLTKKPANPNYFTKASEQKPEKYKYLAHELTNPFLGIKEGEVYTDGEAYTYAKGPDENGYYYPAKLWDEDNGPHFNDGYDYAGGRNSEGVYYAQYILELATGYLMTGDMKFAELAYDMFVSLCDEENWYHWAHAHYLSTGETLTRLGLAYDWLYDEWVEIQNTRAPEYSLANLTQRICDKAYFYGYEISVYSRTSDEWRRDNFGATTGQWNWSVDTINWNCVCNCGLVIGAMAIVGEGEKLGLDFMHEDGNNMVKWSLCNSMWRIAEHGLIQYAPDGSYIESGSYWAYATNYHAEMIAAIITAYGDDLGFLETPGIEKTFYFAVQIEFPTYRGDGSRGYNMWAYNDGGMNSQQDTKTFFLAADYLKDPALAAIRIDGIENRKGVAWDDIVGYKPEYSTLSMADVSMERDWELQTLDGVVARSSWEDMDGVFCGVMGNHNNQIQHDQVDSGNFVYASQGYFWIPDLGADDYNVYEYWGNDIRERYYRNSPEGHNLVLVTSLQDEAMPYGQVLTGGGTVEKIIYGGDAGMYAVINNAAAYGTITNYARRGMLFTNSRETVVIQDEIAFKGVQSCAWVAHTEANVNISNDGKTAYLSANVGGYTRYVRLTLLSDSPKLKFERMTCGLTESDFLMDGAHRPGYSRLNGGVAEYERRSLSRLVVKADNVLVFNMAVVIEVVDKAFSNDPVRYEYTNINKWEIKEDFEGVKQEQTSTDTSVATAKLTDIKTFGTQARKLVDSGYALTTRVADFYRFLVRVSMAVNTYRSETFKNIEQINTAYEKYLTDLALYNAYRGVVNGMTGAANGIGSDLCYGA